MPNYRSTTVFSAPDTPPDSPHTFALSVVPMPRVKRRVDIISSTMTPQMEQLVADAAVNALNQLDVEKEYCKFVKTYLDDEIGPAFHCVCGRKFGAFVSSKSLWSFCFRIDGLTFLVFRSFDLPPNGSDIESRKSRGSRYSR